MSIRKLIIELKETRFIGGNNSEEVYYENLFINSPFWNKPFPNLEEWQRWLIIRSFIENDIIKNVYNHDRTTFRILDVGCGRGWLSNLCSAYGEVTGIEPVKKVVKYAKKKFPALDIRCETPDELLEQQAQYDLIICSEVIEHIPDSEKNSFVEKLFLLSKFNSYIILTTPRKEILNEWLQYTNPSQPIEDWLSEQQVQLLFGNFQVVNKKHLSIAPKINISPMPVYQLWLFRKS